MKRNTVIIIIAVAVILTGTAALVIKKTHSNPNKPANNTSTQSQSSNNTAKSSDYNPSDAFKNGTTQKSENTEASNVYIDKIYQSESRDLVVQTRIVSIASGECALTLQKGNKAISKKADLIYQPTYSTCAGFTIPYNELGEVGEWRVQLTVTHSSVTTNSKEQTFNVQ